MRKEVLCVLGGLLVACGVQAQQGPADYYPSPYYQGGVQPVQMGYGAGYGGYGSYYPGNYGYAPSYPANYGYAAPYGYGGGYGNGAGVPSAGVQFPSGVTGSPADVSEVPAGDQPAPAGVGAGAPGSTFWVTADFLLASVQRQSLRTPLVTTGSSADPIPTALGQPNTAVVFGANGLGTGFSTGIRGEVGMFLDANHTFSMDVSGFILFPEAVRAGFASDANGFPAIGRPYINSVDGQLRAEQSSYNPFFSGGTTVDSSTRLYGFETNARCNGCLGTHWKADLLVGFRLLRLEDTLTVSDSLTPVVGGANVLTFLGQVVNPLSTLTDQDRFSTTNTFYGINLGGRLRWEYDWLSFTAFGKVAVGATEETVRINGITTLTGPAGTQSAVGGILALPSNIGTRSRSVFGVVPETGFTIGAMPINHVRLTAGYSFMYWNAVARPGDQIDPRLNRSAIPGDPTFGQATNGGASPTFKFHDSSFRVQTLTAGIEFFY